MTHGEGLVPTVLKVVVTDWHTSVFDVDDLNREVENFSAHGIQQSEIELPPARPWDAMTGSNVARVSYDSVVSGNMSLGGFQCSAGGQINLIWRSRPY